MSGEVKLTAASGGGSISIKGPSSSGSDVDLLDTSGNLAISGTSTLTGNVTASGTLTTTGNVGIGTSTITGASGHSNLFLGGAANIYAETTGGAGNSFSISQNAHIDSDSSWEYIVTDEASNMYMNAGVTVFRNAASGTGGNDITWSERLRINADGKVGIGTGGNADQLFHIQDTSNSPIMQISSSSYHSYIGTIQSADNISNGTAAGELHLRGQAGFSISANGGSATHLALTNTGRISVPETYSASGSSMRDVQVESNGNYCGQSSIRAAKKNITELTDVSWIYDLKPVSFNYRKRTEDSEGVVTWLEDTESEKAHGLIAEDVEAVNKDFVFYNKDKDGNDVLAGVYYKPLISPLLKAIKDLKLEVDTLKTKVATLEAG